MVEQLTLPDPPGEVYAGRDHPPTSRDLKTDPGVLGQAGSDERRCLRLIRLAGEIGHTSDELSAILSEDGRIIPPNQISSRVLSLRRAGKVRDSGRTRKTRRGRKAIIWVPGEEA